MPSGAMSGVSLSDEIKPLFDDMKHGKKVNRYLQMKMSEDFKEIVVDKSAPKSESYDDFVAQLPPKECRYAVVDFAYEGNETGSKEVLIFVVWCPDNASVKHKMLYASSKDAVKSTCTGVAAEIQATDFDEVSAATILDKVKSKK